MPGNPQGREQRVEYPVVSADPAQSSMVGAAQATEGAILLARIRAAGSTSANVAAGVMADAASAAGLIDRQLVEVIDPSGTRRVLALGWAGGAAPDPDQHPSAPPRRLGPVQLLTWATCLAAAWPRAEDVPYPGRPFRRDDILRACLTMGAHSPAVVAALRMLPQAGLIRFTGPVGTLGPAAAAIPSDTWSALRRMHDRLPHTALRQQDHHDKDAGAPADVAAAAGVRWILGPPAGPVGVNETAIRAAVTALENAHGPVARSDLGMLADPVIRRAVENALIACGRSLILTPKGSWTTGYSDPVAAALVREQVGTLRSEQRAVLALVLLRAVAIPRAQGRLDGAWTSSSHPVTLDELAANRQLNRSRISNALQELRAAGYVSTAPSGGYILGPAMSRLSPASVQALWEDLIVLTRPGGYLAERIRSRRADGTAAVAPESRRVQEQSDDHRA